ncbi:MAG: 2-oxoacid:acceptor oxidoreductase family protein [Cloacibacillus evryensis]
MRRARHDNFTRTLFCADSAGRASLVLGQLVAGAIEEGRHVTWLPSYGPEMRGSTANCGVTISDSEISPLRGGPTSSSY